MYYLKNLWNYEYIEKQAMQQYYYSQMFQTADCVCKLRDFLDSADQMKPEYKDQFISACCSVVLEHARKYGDME